MSLNRRDHERHYYPDVIVTLPPCYVDTTKSYDLNGTNGTEKSITSSCNSQQIPTSKELFHDLPPGGIVLSVLLGLFTLLTIAIYVEEIVFILKHFRKGIRKQKTIWILAFFSVYSMTGLLACYVPRSGTLCDMVSAVFFSTCLYNFGRLMVCYMGGAKRMWAMIEDDRPVHLNVPPCCCCCVCLPKPIFRRKLYFKITMLILQVAIIRPILTFLAAVLWTNGSYLPGDMSAKSSYLYIAIINLLSTISAMYGLMLLRGIFQPELEKQFSITGKIACLQLTLLCSSLPNVLIGILVELDVIKCGPIFPSKGRGEAIYHSFLVLLMLPLALLGRHFYRRESDGLEFAEALPGRKVAPPVNELATGEEEEHIVEYYYRPPQPPPPNNNYENGLRTPEQSNVLITHRYHEVSV